MTHHLSWRARARIRSLSSAVRWPLAVSYLRKTTRVAPPSPSRNLSYPLTNKAWQQSNRPPQLQSPSGTSVRVSFPHATTDFAFAIALTMRSARMMHDRVHTGSSNNDRTLIRVLGDPLGPLAPSDTFIHRTQLIATVNLDRVNRD